MKNLTVILILTVSLNLTAQIEIESYTQYGYERDFENKKMFNIDGDQFYWYFNVDLGNSIYNENNPTNVSEFNANGFLLRKDYLNKTNFRSKISRVKTISYKDGSISTIFYSSDNSYDSLTLRIENGGFKITVCNKSKTISGKDTCVNASIHSSVRFEDNYYISKLPSQKLD